MVHRTNLYKRMVSNYWPLFFCNGIILIIRRSSLM